MLTPRTNAQIALRTEGVSVLIDVSTGRLPVIVHWGDDLGEQTPDDFAALTGAGIPPSGPNLIDEPPTLGVLPEHWTGWVGRPGISGSRQGRDWSPKFTSTEVRLDGVALAAPTDSPTVVNAGRASVEVDAVDEAAGLQLTLLLELTEMEKQAGD